MHNNQQPGTSHATREKLIDTSHLDLRDCLDRFLNLLRNVNDMINSGVRGGIISSKPREGETGYLPPKQLSFLPLLYPIIHKKLRPDNGFWDIMMGIGVMINWSMSRSFDADFLECCNQIVLSLVLKYQDIVTENQTKNAHLVPVSVHAFTHIPTMIQHSGPWHLFSFMNEERGVGSLCKGENPSSNAIVDIHNAFVEKLALSTISSPKITFLPMTLEFDAHTSALTNADLLGHIRGGISSFFPDSDREYSTQVCALESTDQVLRTKDFVRYNDKIGTSADSSHVVSYGKIACLFSTLENG